MKPRRRVAGGGRGRPRAAHLLVPGAAGRLHGCQRCQRQGHGAAGLREGARTSELKGRGRRGRGSPGSREVRAAAWGWPLLALARSPRALSVAAEAPSRPLGRRRDDDDDAAPPPRPLRAPPRPARPGRAPCPRPDSASFRSRFSIGLRFLSVPYLTAILRLQTSTSHRAGASSFQSRPLGCM